MSSLLRSSPSMPPPTMNESRLVLLMRRNSASHVACSRMALTSSSVVVSNSHIVASVHRIHIDIAKRNSLRASGRYHVSRRLRDIWWRHPGRSRFWHVDLVLMVKVEIVDSAWDQLPRINFNDGSAVHMQGWSKGSSRVHRYIGTKGDSYPFSCELARVGPCTGLFA
jgi:hypothetical protein